MNRTIIIGIDFSKNSLSALRLGVDLCNRSVCDLLMVWVKKDNEDREKNESVLKQLCESFRPLMKSTGISYRIEEGKKVAKSLVKVISEVKPKMVIMGTYGLNTEKDRKMAGSNTMKILIDCPAPLMTIKPDFNFNKPLDNIIIPLDSTLETRQKIPASIEIARLFSGACLHILGLYSSTSKDIHRIVDKYAQSTDEFLTRHSMLHTVQCREADNNTLTTIDFAEKVKGDLIVMMSTQESGSMFNFLSRGSFAQQMLNLSPIPVLTIPTKEISGSR